jgi:Na+/melibiose symporter-like transporter
MTDSAEPAQPSAAPTRPPHTGVPYMAAMGLMSAGFSAVDFITDNMIPITLRHFTDSRLLISIIIDLNRLFGFIVQPFVAWKSDRLNSRFGRRRPFMLVALPTTLFFMLLLGFFPTIFKDEIAQRAAHAALSTLVLLFIVNVLLQAALDVNWGVEALLYADTVPRTLLGRAYSVRETTRQVVKLMLLLVSLPLATRSEVYPYLGSGIMVMISLLLVLFVIRERPRRATPVSSETFRVLRNLKIIITNRTYLKIAVVGSLQLVFAAVFTIFLSLFAKETLQMTMKEFSREVLLLGFIVGVGTALIGGQIVDRIGAKYVAAMGFVLCLVASALMVWIVHDKSALKWANAISLGGQAFIGVAAFPLLFTHAPEDERGRVFGLIQFLRAFSAFSITPFIGHLADVFKSYRPGYVVAIVLAFIGAAAALSVPAKPATD